MDYTPGGSSTEENVLFYTRKEVFDIVKGHLRYTLAALLEYLGAEISKKSGLSVLIRDDMKQSFSTLFNRMRKKWQLVNRHANVFYKKYEKWLDVHVSFPVAARLSADFESSSERSKRRKIEEVRATLTTRELAYATQISLRFSGQLSAAKVVKGAMQTTPRICVRNCRTIC